MNIRKMIPFMDEDEIRNLAREILDGNEDYKGISLESLLPLMDEDDIDDIALEIYHKEGNVSAILPFISEEAAAELAREVLECEDDPDISAILPFMDDEDVDEIAADLYRKKRDVHAILPFVSEEGAAVLANTIVELEEKPDIVSILPFMDDDDIDELFVKMVRMGTATEAMYPFVSEDGWHQVLKGYEKGEFEFDFDEAYPFMDDDDIRDLFRYEMKHRK